LAKRESTVDIALLEYCLREDLNKVAPRVMAVLRPLRVVLENYPEGHVEMLDAENNPEDPSMGTRKIPFSRELYIEQDDFREDPPRKFFRLAPGREVRLKHAYYIKCEEIIRDSQSGEIVELRCTYDPDTKGGWSKDGRMVRGTLHWVSASQAIPAEVRLYDHLFSKQDPTDEEEGGDWQAFLNSKSLEVLPSCQVEPSLAATKPGDRFQFLRKGYFCLDSGDSSADNLVFNRTATLRDTWAKIEKSQNKSSL
jgi:glutaminyl-tRNA synthetase